MTKQFRGLAALLENQGLIPLIPSMHVAAHNDIDKNGSKTKSRCEDEQLLQHFFLGIFVIEENSGMRYTKPSEGLVFVPGILNHSTNLPGQYFDGISLKTGYCIDL